MNESTVARDNAAAPPAVAPQLTAAPNSDERWAAWQARGAANDRLFRRQVRIAVPIFAVVAIILYVFFLR